MLPRDYDPENNPEHRPYWHEGLSDEERRTRFWGPNLWPMVMQMSLGLGMLWFLNAVGFGQFFYDLSCTYITGSCL